MIPKSEAEKEKGMYAICFSILAICLVSLFFLSNNSQITIYGIPITGAVVLEPNIAREEVFIDYTNISFENITQEIALNAILQAEKDMWEMQEAGFNVVWINDTLIEAKKYFEGEDYTALLQDIRKISDSEAREKAKTLLMEAQKKIGVPVDYKKVLEKTKAINERKIKAYEITDYIRASELRIDEIKEAEQQIETPKKNTVGRAFGLGMSYSETIDTTPIDEILSNAETEFKEERYDNAVELLAQIEPKIDEIKSENTLVKTIYRAGKDNIISFIKENYPILLMFLGLLLVTFILTYNRIMMAVLRRKIKDMKIEKDVVMELMKKAQRDYFAKGDITKQTFEIKMAHYKDKMAEIKQKLPVAETLLEKRLHSKRML